MIRFLFYYSYDKKGILFFIRFYCTVLSRSLLSSAVPPSPPRPVPETSLRATGYGSSVLWPLVCDALVS
jgi:hypothetical protein